MSEVIQFNENALWETIKTKTIQLENEISDFNSMGIFFAPELHIAFEFGKAIYKKREEIFGTNVNIEWIREKTIKGFEGVGIFDIMFKYNSEIILLIELKLASKSNKYIADINKLALASNVQDKYFCALVNKFSENKRIDARFDIFNSDSANNLFSNIYSDNIKTNYNKDKSKEQQYCYLALGKVK